MADENQQPAETIHVLLVVDKDVYTRLGSVVWHLGVGLMDEPVRMTILARTERYPSGDAIGPWPVISLPPRAVPWPRAKAASMLKLIGGEKPDVVHCMSAELAQWVLPWATQWESPLLVHLTDRVDIQNYRSLQKNPSVYAVVLDQAMSESVDKKRRRSGPPVRVMPLGLPAGKEPAGFAHPERVPAVVVTTPLVKRCGLESVLKSLATIVKEERELQLFILNSGPAERYFRGLVEHYQVRPYVTFAGRMRNWSAQREALRGGDMLIMPGSNQRFSINTLIAMATGLVVLAPNDTTENYLIDGTTASLFDPRIPESLTEKWLSLLDHRDEASRLAQSALDYVRSHYQASTMAAATGALYRELCDAGQAVVPSVS
jgi:glycosyltransferase involved in cell wall biosynthesis